VALIASLREAFDRDGTVRVAGAIAPADVRAMRACMLERIAGIDFVELAGARRPAPGLEPAMWAIGREPAFAPLPAALAGAIERVFGPGAWAQTASDGGGLAMPNLPCADAAWSVCDGAWHVDEPTQPAQPRGWALLGFALVDLVEPGGGATAMIAGSHRRLGALADRLGTTVATAEALALPRDDWRVVELCGDAGDVVLMDPRCLHTITANVSPRPRLAMRMTCARAF
jgi:hypothetical protein